jgi:hypothetical protein
METDMDDFTLSLNELQALGAQLRGPFSILSPFQGQQPASSNRVENPALILPNGKLKPELESALKVISQASSRADLGVMWADEVFTAVSFQGEFPEESVMMLDAATTFRILSPASFGHFAASLGRRIGESSVNHARLDIKLDRLEAWMFLAAVDACRLKNMPVESISGDVIYLLLNLEDEMQSLASTFAMSLGLEMPSESDVTEAWKNLLIRKPGFAQTIPEIASAYASITCHVHMQYLYANPSPLDRFLMTECMWGMQGDQGDILLWSNTGGLYVQLMTVSSAFFLQLLIYSMDDPCGFLKSQLKPPAEIQNTVVKSNMPISPAPALQTIPVQARQPAAASSAPANRNGWLIAAVVGISALCCCALLVLLVL